jgi:hypothetical protein
LRRIIIAFARTAGVAGLLFAYAETTVAEGLGQFFFSAEERHILDELRDAGEDPPTVEPSDGTNVEAAPIVDVISFDGLVKRSGGGSTVWVNGRPVYTGSTTAEGIAIETSPGPISEKRFVLPRSDENAKPTEFSLKVGQKVAVQNGQKFDAYERRPGEDAETVFENAPADGTAPPAGVNSPSDDGSTTTRAAPKGS